jgi:ABC-type polysaccharide/polyol phosphate transport system ATPase subunit
MPAIAFQNVSRSFHRHAGRVLLRDRIAHLLRPEPRERFYALRDVSFEAEAGESLGIIGHNGAGKSTLLNLATSLCDPSDGTVTVNGRVAALLELGAGFHPDLTGAENVRINAALLGLDRTQARARFVEIVEFSGIADFINEPLRTYSSGMMMRLAFSVAVNVDPDILIIDEVLGVGDQAFFAKCFDRIMEFRQTGKTLLCVSHSLSTLATLCDRGLWLDHGRVVGAGPMRALIEEYTQSSGIPLKPVAESR